MKLNKKGRPFSWSFSSLTNFEGCPARYAAEKFYCTLPWVETEQQRWGNRVHKAGENFIKCIPDKDDEALAPVEAYVTAMIRSGHRLEPELEVTLTRNLTPTSWFAKDAWFRGKLDVVLTKVKEKAVVYYDYKTGKIKDSPDQLRICIAALSVLRPQIENFDGKFIWTAHKQVTGIKPISKSEIPSIWQEFLPRVERMEQAWESENFPCRPGPLCPWCAVPNCACKGEERGEYEKYTGCSRDVQGRR